jgi:GxxExxY protein
MGRRHKPTPMPTLKPLLHSDLTGSIIRCFYAVYNTLDFGLLEKAYSVSLERELRAAGHVVDREVLTVVRYKGVPVAHYKIDMVVDQRVIVEVKSTRVIPDGVDRQVYTYLRATNYDLGLLLHFGTRPTFKRFICTLDRKSGFDLREGSAESGAEPP